MGKGRALSKVTRRAGQLVAAESAFREAVREAHAAGASTREIEAAAREHVNVGGRRGFTRERIRVILLQGGEQG